PGRPDICVSQHVNLAVRILAETFQERSERTLDISNAEFFDRARAQIIQIKKPAAGRTRSREIAENIFPLERQNAAAAITKTAEDRDAVIETVFHQRIDERRI